MARITSAFVIFFCLFSYVASSSSNNTTLPQEFLKGDFLALSTLDLSKFKLPFIIFPGVYHSQDVVESLLWQNAGQSDLLMTALVTQTGYDPVTGGMAGTIFSKDADGQNYGRVEVHQDGHVSIFGFGIGGTPGSGCFSPDGNHWCSFMVSSIPLPLNTPVQVTFIRKGTQLGLYFNLHLVASYTISPVSSLTSTINWRVGTRMVSSTAVGQPGHNIFFGTIANAILFPGIPF